MNFSALTTKRSWSAVPIELPCESKHSMRNDSLRPSTATSVAVQVITSPTFEAFVCCTVSPIPTVVSSSYKSFTDGIVELIGF